MMVPAKVPRFTSNTALAAKIGKLCEAEKVVSKSDGPSVDPLFWGSINSYPMSSLGRFGFYSTDARAPRFSLLLTKPNKATEVLEKALSEATDVYSGFAFMIPAVIFNIDGQLFVYSEKQSDKQRIKHPFIHVRNNNRSRYIYELKKFLSAMGMSEAEEED